MDKEEAFSKLQKSRKGLLDVKNPFLKDCLGKM